MSNDFLTRLHICCDKLFFEISGRANETQELIISAEGDKRYYHQVEKLGSAAPRIKNWQIVAFKPSMGVDFVIDNEDLVLDPHKIWFLPLENENNPTDLGLKICVPNYSRMEKERILKGCYQMLDTMLGEKMFMQDVQHIEVDMLPKNPIKERLIELVDLPRFIEWRKSRKNT